MVLPSGGLRVAGLFAGIAGVEVGLGKAGHHAEFFCEFDPAAAAVLAARFPGVPIDRDIRSLKSLPAVDVVCGGFPCQDLSQAGRTAGIGGRNSGLVDHVFRLIEHASPRWLVLENVPFMLALDRGAAMLHLTSRLASLGFTWAYRVVDARAFGLPQRRQRVIMVASRYEDPRGVLLSDDAGPPEEADSRGKACGFYWTEGVRGLGWAVDAVPTLKGGSTIGIPSPPAIWMPTGEIVTPDIRDAERLQGFRGDWTAPAATVSARRGTRWKLVGNAVSTPVFEWVGKRLAAPRRYTAERETAPVAGGTWPHAAWGSGGTAIAVDVSKWPVRKRPTPLIEFLRYPTRPLSARASAGFLARASTSTLRFPPGFLPAVERHRAHMDGLSPVAQR